MDTRARVVAAACLGLGAVLPFAGPAHAQDAAVKCERASADVSAQAQHPLRLRDAYHALLDCPQAGEVLAKVWGTPPTDTASLSLLVATSADVADRRILAATVELMARSGAPEVVRRAALRVALAQYEPSLGIDDASFGEAEGWGLTFTPNYSQRVGSRTIMETDRAAMRGALRRITIEEAGTSWGRVAQGVARALSHWERAP